MDAGKKDSNSARGRCASCGGVRHPDTDAALSERTWICGTCARGFTRWLAQWTRPRRKGLDFYAAAGRDDA